jgi:hypothetical protein
MRRLGLHQLTLTDADPLALVSIAHAVGCPKICVFVHVEAAGYGFQ